MTCIAVVRKDEKIYMSGERGVSDDDIILQSATSKVWQQGPYLFGYAGTMDGDRIKHNFKPSAPTGNNIEKFIHRNIHIINVQQLREFTSTYSVDKRLSPFQYLKNIFSKGSSYYNQ